jgi:hypothetical protein
MPTYLNPETLPKAARTPRGLTTPPTGCQPTSETATCTECTSVYQRSEADSNNPGLCYFCIQNKLHPRQVPLPLS